MEKITLQKLKLGDKEIGFAETDKMKIVRSPDYNYNFHKETGFFMRWGKDMDDDPDFAPAPEILDIEISTICIPGKGGGGCSFCYKSNTADGINMSLETFKIIFDKIVGSTIEVELEDGKIIELNPSQKVELTNGEIKIAEELTEDDEIDIIQKDIVNENK